MRFPALVGPSYQLQSVTADNQATVNLFVEINQLGTGKNGEPALLVETPGLLTLLTLPTSPVRGIYTASNDEVYAVGGNKLYSLSSSWVATELGSLNTSEGPVSMSDNGTHLVLVDGTDGFVWNMSTDTFSEITDPDFKAADQVAYINRTFIFNESGTGRFFYAGLDDVTFDALDIGTAEASPDVLRGIHVMNQQIYMVGSLTTEIFYDSGDADEPFQRIEGAAIAFGTIAPFSIQEVDDSVCFLGRDKNGTGVIYRLKGGQPQRISTPTIEAVIRGLTQSTLPDARAWAYQQGGHHFYCLNLPGDTRTWCYDTTTGLWHERQYRNLWDLERHRAECHTVAHSRNIVGDYQNGKIYALDPDTRTDADNPIVRLRRGPHFSSNGRRIFHHRLEIDMETGVGIDGSGQGSAPKLMLRWSNDSGRTWSNYREGEIGEIGETTTRVVFRRLGSARNRIYELSISDPVKVVINGAEIEVTEGVA